MAPNHTKLDEATYVVLDLETTGLDHRTERITEIGAVKMVGGTPIDTFEQLVSPNRLIPPKITKLTGITNDMVYDKPSIETILPKIADFIGNAILVVHNAPFDISFLNAAARRAKHKTFCNRYFDTRFIAQKILPLLGFYRLANLAEHFNTENKPGHRALTDALATSEVFAGLMEIMMHRDLDTVDKASEFFYPKQRHDFVHKKEFAISLPSSSGVYLMKSRFGGIIYVGKAKDLKKRVKSYFYEGLKTDRQLSLLGEVESIDHITTETEIGALLLESKLIKKYKPDYNIRGKRPRKYPFVYINYEDEFPTPKIVNKITTGNGFHYGPFSNTADLELLIEVTKDLYGLKQCDRRIGRGGRARPCFYFQVKRCSGPCGDHISKAEYLNRLSSVMSAFEGNPDALRRELIGRRDNAADRLFFEKALLLQRALESLNRTSKILEGICNAHANLNFMLIEHGNGATGNRGSKNTFRVYLVADGQLTSCVNIKNNKRGIALLHKKVAGAYFSSETVSHQIDAEQIDNLSLLASYFQRRPVKKIKVGNSLADTMRDAMDMLDFKPRDRADRAGCRSSFPPQPIFPGEPILQLSGTTPRNLAAPATG